MGSWVHWYNAQRLHDYLDYVPPRDFEENWRRRASEPRQRDRW
jgi:transposase InsO family protein